LTRAAYRMATHATTSAEVPPFSRFARLIKPVFFALSCALGMISTVASEQSSVTTKFRYPLAL
jgi:hypothetical protein